MATLITSAALLLANMILRNRLSAFVQPLRLEMAELGESLLAEEILPAKAKSTINYDLDTAFDGWRAWFFVFAVPFAAVVIVVEMIFGKITTPAKIPDHLRSDYDRFQRLAIVCRFANSPLATLILIIEAVFMFVIFLPVYRIGQVVDWILMTLDRKNSVNTTGHHYS